MRNCNAAAERARGEVIIFLNNDTIPLDRWLDEIVDTMRLDPRVGLAGPKYINADGSLQEAGGVIWSDGSAENFGRGGDPAACCYNYITDIDYVSGAALAVRADIWRQLDGFDEAFVPAYYEDVDLAFRVRAAGLRTIYQPLSCVIHFEGISHGRDLSSGIKSYQVKNSATFLERWKETIAIESAPRNCDADPRGYGANQRRPRILIIDHYVPQPDRDSGSRAMLDYVQLFANNGFHVVFWPQNLHFDRNYTPLLQRLGVEVIYATSGFVPNFDEWLEKNGASLEYALLSRPSVAVEFIDRLASRSDAKVLFFGVDIHFQRLQREFKTTSDRLAYQTMLATEKLERHIWSKSDVICYYSNEERDFIRGQYPQKAVRSVPVFLIASDRLTKTRQRIKERELALTKQVIFVAGFGHTPNVDAVLWLAAKIWPAVTSAIPDAQLCIVGSSPPPDVYALAGPSIIVTGPVSDPVLHLLYQCSSLSVVPLRYGAGVKGKVLEAISLGVPVVTTKTGVQGIPGAANFVDVCEGEEDLAAAMIDILRNPVSRKQKIMTGLNYLEREMSESAARRILSQDIPELGAGRHRKSVASGGRQSLG